MTLNRESFRSGKDWMDYVRQQVSSAATERGINPAVAFAIAEQESSWKPDAVGNPNNGSVDAGLMQVNSINWPRFGINSAADVTGKNWKRGVDIGLDIFKEDLARAKGNVPLALASYNAGPGRVNEWQATGKLPEITRVYVPTVMARASKFGLPLAQGDFNELMSTFKPAKSAAKILQAADVLGKLNPDDAVAIAKSVAGAPQRLSPPNTWVHENAMANTFAAQPISVDTTQPLDQQAAQPVAQPAEQQNNFAAQPPQYAQNMHRPPVFDFEGLNRQLDDAFKDPNGADEMSDPFSKYLDGLIDA